MTEQVAHAAAPAFINRKVHIDNLRLGKNIRTVDAGTKKKPRMTHALLVASIEAIGLLFPLVVTEGGEGEGGAHFVEDGKGRYDALRELHAAGKLADPMIDCRLPVGAADPVALALIANVAREPMHPADECVAFQLLAEKGMSIDQIGGMFAMRSRSVRQRLALGTLAPALLNAFKNGEISLEVAEAFTVEPDTKRQLEAWKHLKQINRLHSAYLVRDALTAQEVGSNDSLVTFIGLQAYIDAGGGFRENLFSENEEERTLTDPGLVETIAAAKLEEVADELRAQGWVDVRVSLERPTEQWEMELLSRPTKEDRATAVHFVYPVGEDAKALGPYITRQAARAKAKAKTQAGQGGAEQGGDATYRVPETLMRSLTAHKSAAMQCALLGNPTVTMAVLAAKLLGDFKHHYESLPVHVSIQHRGGELENEARGYEGSRAAGELVEADAAWDNRGGDDLLAYFLSEDVSVSLEAIAYCTARSFSFVNTSQGAPFGVSEIQKALGFDTADYFKPTGETYLSQVPKARVIGIVADACGKEAAAPLEGMKKAELVASAEQKLSATRWVPEVIA